MSGSTSAAEELQCLFRPAARSDFEHILKKLHTRFRIYADTCPAPLPAPGLIVTPEIRNQCRLYLPFSEIAAAFNRLYGTALAHQPVFSSTPFHNALSWADCYSTLAPEFQSSANPARLLEALLDDKALLTRFIFASFLPERFYGRAGRYPLQHQYIKQWLRINRKNKLHCLDAACGTGEETYSVLRVLAESGISAEQVLLEGWSIDPLEIWAARHRRLPHNPLREAAWRASTNDLIHGSYSSSISFSCRDITSVHGSGSTDCFDLIICNGLLGGPIIHERAALESVVTNLADMLTPCGVVLAANNFHGGWQQQCPQNHLRALFEKNGLVVITAGEGFCGLKSDQ